MKLIIAGCRNFVNQDFIIQHIDENVVLWDIKEVVCGGAEGVDKIGAYWAQIHKIPVAYHIAEWRKFGPSAGPIRNKKMAEYGDELLAIWDGKSKGTKNMIDQMNKLGKPVKVVIVDIKIAKALPPIKR